MLPVKKKKKVRKPRVPSRPTYSQAVDYINAFRDWLNATGYEEIGSGIFSTCYAKPRSNRCIKISTDETWISYMMWMNRSKIRRDSRFAPKLYSLRWIRHYYIAEMERVPYRAYSNDHRHITNALFSIQEAILGARDSTYKRKLKLNPGHVALLETRGTGIPEFLHAVYSRYSDDFHAGNFAFRKDGSWCLFDPATCQRKGSADHWSKKKPTYEKGKRIS